MYTAFFRPSNDTKSESYMAPTFRAWFTLVRPLPIRSPILRKYDFHDCNWFSYLEFSICWSMQSLGAKKRSIKSLSKKWNGVIIIGTCVGVTKTSKVQYIAMVLLSQLQWIFFNLRTSVWVDRFMVKNQIVGGGMFQKCRGTFGQQQKESSYFTYFSGRSLVYQKLHIGWFFGFFTWFFLKQL